MKQTTFGELLGRSVRRRAYFDDSRQAKVSDLHGVVLADENVAGSEI